MGETIKRTYNSFSDRDISFLKIKPHEVRALSASWAFFNHVPLQDVLRAAVWRSETTFSSFYLRSMAKQADGMSQLGPIVAAQRVVMAREPSTSQ